MLRLPAMIKLITTTGSGAPVQAATTANARLVSSANRRMGPILSPIESDHRPAPMRSAAPSTWIAARTTSAADVVMPRCP